MPASALMNVMLGAARKAGRSLARDFGEVGQLQVSIKGPANFVTAADHRAEEIIFSELSRARPGYGCPHAHRLGARVLDRVPDRLLRHPEEERLDLGFESKIWIDVERGLQPACACSAEHVGQSGRETRIVDAAATTLAERGATAGTDGRTPVHTEYPDGADLSRRRHVDLCRTGTALCR